MTYSKARNEKDMLEGNINRMFITDEYAELESMKEWAIQRIETIYEINKSRLDSETHTT